MYCTFGCRAFVHVLKKDRGPLDSRTGKCIFIGFEDGYKGWKVYNPVTRKVLISRDVIFDETSFPGTTAISYKHHTTKLLSRTLWPIDEDQKFKTTAPDNEDPIVLPALDQDTSEQDENQEVLETLPSTSAPQPRSDHEEPSPNHIPTTIQCPDVPTNRVAPLVAQGDRPIRSTRVLDYGMLDGRTRRTTRPVARRQHKHEVEGAHSGGNPPQVTDGEIQGNDEPGENALQTDHIPKSVNPISTQEAQYISVLDAFEIAFEIIAERAFGAVVRPEDSPNGWREAMARPDRKRWIEAAGTEVNALISNGTWELVELPPGRQAIGSRWVFLIKHKSDGEIDRYKAHLVAWGDNQRPGIDYNQVFTPAARLAALRSILALAAIAGEHIESVDISNAYLNGELEKEHDIYMKQPEGFTQYGPNGERLVCRLIKGLYV